MSVLPDERPPAPDEVPFWYACTLVMGFLCALVLVALYVSAPR